MRAPGVGRPGVGDDVRLDELDAVLGSFGSCATAPRTWRWPGRRPPRPRPAAQPRVEGADLAVGPRGLALEPRVRRVLAGRSGRRTSGCLRSRRRVILPVSRRRPRGPARAVVARRAAAGRRAPRGGRWWPAAGPGGDGRLRPRPPPRPGTGPGGPTRPGGGGGELSRGASLSNSSSNTSSDGPRSRRHGACGPPSRDRVADPADDRRRGDERRRGQRGQRRDRRVAAAPAPGPLGQGRPAGPRIGRSSRNRRRSSASAAAVA